MEAARHNKRDAIYKMSVDFVLHSVVINFASDKLSLCI